MSSAIYNDTVDFIDVMMSDYDYYRNLLSQMKNSDTIITMHQNIIKKKIDESWISIIEQSLPYVDAYLRKPMRDIKEVEEVLPMEMTRKVVPRALQHLATHTNYINSIDEDGNIIPSKLLNIYKEENLATYESRFVNTLVDKLFGFVYTRYEKLKKYAKDEYSSLLDFSVVMKTQGTKVKISYKIESVDEDDTDNIDNSDDIKQSDLWGRLERIKNIVDAFKGSDFCVKMGKDYIKPPVMRTNAILKNFNLKNCLILWQFIEGYDKIGYEVQNENTDQRPNEMLLDELYSLLAFQYVVFRENTRGDLGENVMSEAVHSDEPVSPRFVKSIQENVVSDYNFYEIEHKPIIIPNMGNKKKKLTMEEEKIKSAIDFAFANTKQIKENEENLISKNKRIFGTEN